MSFNSLPGFREYYPEDCFLRNYLFQEWRQVARRFNFLEFDAPVLEPLELFTLKSGDEIVGQLFNFEDRGGRAIALRPEMTPSLSRLVGAKANSMRRPIKWFSIGEQFRYERPQKGRLRSFYQFNADILGEPSMAADAEAIALLIQTLNAFGLTDKQFCIRLSDRDLWIYYLQTFGLNEASIQEVLSVIDKIDKDSEETTKKRLEPHFKNQLESFLSSIQKLVKLCSIDEIFAFFENLSSDAESPINKRLDDWRELFKGLNSMGLGEFIRIDLSIVRGLAYYTGFVFEAFQTVGEGRALAGGGRYDHLVEKLAGVDLPAVGFAIGDVTLLALLQQENLLPEWNSAPDIYVIIGGEEERVAALEDIAVLRKEGFKVDYALKSTGLNKQFKQAGQVGAAYALIYAPEEVQQNKVLLKDLEKREEELIERDTLLSVVQLKLKAQ